MLTSLDLLIIVFLALVGAGVLSGALMFIIRNKIAQRVFFYQTVALSLFVCYAGVMIGNYFFPVQTAVAVILGSVAVGALVVQLCMRNNKIAFLIVRIAAVLSLVLGIINAFCM